MNTSNVRDEIEINLMDLFRFLKTRWAVMVAAALLCALIGALLPPAAPAGGEYEAATNLMVYADDLKLPDGVSEQSELSRLSASAAAMTQSYRVYAAALAQMGSNMTPAELSACVSVGTMNNTQMLYIAVKHTDKAFAEEAAAAIAAVAPSIVTEALPDVTRMTQFGEVSVSGKEGTPGSRTKNIVLGGVLGLVGALMVVLMLEVLHTGVKSEEELEQLIQVPVLGVLPTEASSVRETARAAKKAGRG